MLLQAGLLVQLHLAQVFVQHRVPDAAPLLPAALAEKARLEYKRISQDVTVSQLQRDVGHVLGELQAAANSPVGGGSSSQVYVSNNAALPP